MSQLHERIQFFSTRNPTQKDFQEMVNGAKRIEMELAEAREEAKNAISILNLWYNLGWSEEYRTEIEELTKLKEQGDEQ